jgi:predicted ArsR family transcriptional regulator
VTGFQRGPTRPSAVYELAPGVTSSLSKAYVPFAAALVGVLADRLPERELEKVMREVGRRMAATLPRPGGRLPDRVQAASDLLTEMGAPNEVERDGSMLRLRSIGCLLAEAVHGRPLVCHAMETLLGELLEAEVRERCQRGTHPRCCFEVKRAG